MCFSDLPDYDARANKLENVFPQDLIEPMYLT